MRTNYPVYAILGGPRLSKEPMNASKRSTCSLLLALMVPVLAGLARGQYSSGMPSAQPAGVAGLGGFSGGARGGFAGSRLARGVGADAKGGGEDVGQAA